MSVDKTYGWKDRTKRGLANSLRVSAKQLLDGPQFYIKDMDDKFTAQLYAAKVLRRLARDLEHGAPIDAFL